MINSTHSYIFFNYSGVKRGIKERYSSSKG